MAKHQTHKNDERPAALAINTKANAKYSFGRSRCVSHHRPPKQAIPKHSFFAEGGSTNPALNPQLKSAIDAANDRDVPQSTIKAVLKKLSEAPDTSAVNRHLFEGRLYGKLFLIISVYTDNLALSRNQLAVPIKKHHFMLNNTKHMFTERGVIAALARPEVRADHFEDDCLNDAIECGAEDIEVHDVAQRQVAFLCEPIEFVKVKQKLTSCGYKIVEADCVFNFDGPTVKLSEEEVKNYDFFKERLQQGLDGFDTIYDNLAEDDDE